MVGMPTNDAGRPHVGVQIAAAPLSSALLQLVRAHAALATRWLADIGLAPPQELVLLFLDEHGPSPQRELVRYLGRDRSTVTATIQTMERGGLVSRRPCGADKRALTVELTAQGTRLCPRVNEIWSRLEDAAFGDLADERSGALATALRQARGRLAAVAESRTTPTTERKNVR